MTDKTPEINPLDVQIGGDHYKKLKIQPMEYSMANGLDACQHTAIKYITRFRDKGGIADLEKAKHCIDLLIGFEKAAKTAEISHDQVVENTSMCRGYFDAAMGQLVRRPVNGCICDLCANAR